METAVKNHLLSTDMKQETKQVAQPKQQHRASIWSRMLVTSTLMFGLAVGIYAVDKTDTATQSNEETTISQSTQETTLYKDTKHLNVKKEKKEKHCSKASKEVEILGVKRKFTAETCDDWDYVKMFFDNNGLSTDYTLSLPKNLGSPFNNRQIYLGIPSCNSWIVAGESDDYRLYIISDVVKRDGEKTRSFSVDTGVPVDPRIKSNLLQLSGCDWNAYFSNSDGSLILRVTEDGKIEPTTPH